MYWRLPKNYRSKVGAVVRAFASHQCGPGSIPTIRGSSLLLVLVPAPRVFLRVLRFSSLHKNQNFQILVRSGNTGQRTSLWMCHCEFSFLYYLIILFKMKPRGQRMQKSLIFGSYKAHLFSSIRDAISQWIGTHSNVQVRVAEPLNCFINIGHCAKGNLMKKINARNCFNHNKSCS